jgi:hypothetical protein
MTTFSPMWPQVVLNSEGRGSSPSRAKRDEGHQKGFPIRKVRTPGHFSGIRIAVQQ